MVVKGIKGFTLIELLVVIAIIGILATFLVANFNSAQQRARDAQRKNDLSQLQKSLELYKSDSAGSTYYAADLTSLAPTYIRRLPTDPSTEANYVYTPFPTTCTSGVTLGQCTTYTLSATLEVETDTSAAKSAIRCDVTAVSKVFTVCDPGGTSAPAPAATSTPTPTATPVPPAP